MGGAIIANAGTALDAILTSEVTVNATGQGIGYYVQVENPSNTTEIIDQYYVSFGNQFPVVDYAILNATNYPIETGKFMFFRIVEFNGTYSYYNSSYYLDLSSKVFDQVDFVPSTSNDSGVEVYSISQTSYLPYQGHQITADLTLTLTSKNTVINNNTLTPYDLQYIFEIGKCSISPNIAWTPHVGDSNAPLAALRKLFPAA